MTTELETAPTVEAPPDQWPPLAHIYDKRDPEKKALCGAKLMGIDLGSLHNAANVCEKCVEILQREMLR